MKNIKLLAGTITLLISTVVMDQAIALPSANLDSPQLLSQIDTTQATMRGTIRAIAGNIVTLEMPDGTTRQVTFSNADLVRLNLQPGTQIALVLDQNNIASGISVVQSNNTTRVGTTQQVIQRTVQTTSSAPVTRQSTVTRTTQVTQTTQPQPQTNMMRPVRALW